MTLHIHQIPAGPLPTNAFLVVDTVSGDAMLVDTPPDVVSQAQRIAEEAGAKLRYIVITHGHWDHITGAADVVNTWPVPVVGHELVRTRLEDASATTTSPVPMRPVNLDQVVEEGDEIVVGAHRFKVMHMPGHDVAHITL